MKTLTTSFQEFGSFLFVVSIIVMIGLVMLIIKFENEANPKLNLSDELVVQEFYIGTVSGDGTQYQLENYNSLIIPVQMENGDEIDVIITDNGFDGKKFSPGKEVAFYLIELRGIRAGIFVPLGMAKYLNQDSIAVLRSEF